MRLLFLLFTIGTLLSFAPRTAYAGCPQVGDGCDAVIKVEATLQGSPACITIDRTETENGCVCQGYAYVRNDCATDLVATDFMWADSSTTVKPGAIGMLQIDGDALGTQHDEFTLSSGGQTFTFALDYTVEHRVLETGSCATTEQNHDGGVGIGIGVAALALTRRRQRGHTNIARAYGQHQNKK